MSVVAMHPVEPPSVEGLKAPYPASEQPAEDSPLYKTDEFRMYCFKVLPCSKRYVHDWTVCPFAHPGEKAKRRDPRVFTYTGVACPDMKKCQRGDACPYAHNVFEYWMHPSRYRTQLCNDGIGCKRKVCFFAHTLDELRVSSVKLVPTDITTGVDSGAFDIDPFRIPRTESGRSTSKPSSSSSSAASATGNEALVEALRAQQQQQHVKKAAALQRSASRGLTAEMQQLQAFQQLQAVLANTPGLGVVQSQLPQQATGDSLLNSMLAQLRLGGAVAQQPMVTSLGSANSGLLDVVLQQAMQQVLANGAAQQAAAALLLLQQQQQHAAAVAAQQQQAAQLQAIFEHLLQQQQQQMASGVACLPNPQIVQAALTMLQQQQQVAAAVQAPSHIQQLPRLAPMTVTGQRPSGPMAMSTGNVGVEPLSSGQSMPPAMARGGMSTAWKPSQTSSLPNSLRSSGTGMALNGRSPSPAAAGSVKINGDGASWRQPAPSSPRALSVVSSPGSPPLETPFASALSCPTIPPAALSAAATAASYYSQEASRSSFESYRSSELDMGFQMPSGHHSSGPSSGGAACTSLDLMNHIAQHSQHSAVTHAVSEFMDMGSVPSPCSPSVPPGDSLLPHEVRHRQMLLTAVQGGGASFSNAPGFAVPHAGTAAAPVELFPDQVTMAAFSAGQQCAAPLLGM